MHASRSSKQVQKQAEQAEIFCEPTAQAAISHSGSDVATTWRIYIYIYIYLFIYLFFRFYICASTLSSPTWTLHSWITCFHKFTLYVILGNARSHEARVQSAACRAWQIQIKLFLSEYLLLKQRLRVSITASSVQKNQRHWFGFSAEDFARCLNTDSFLSCNVDKKITVSFRSRCDYV